jgi:hypothetical protein
VGPHPDGSTDFSTILSQECSDQFIVVELIGDGGEDLGPARRCQTQNTQGFPFGGVPLVFAQVFDVFDQCNGELIVILRPIESTDEGLAFLKTTEGLESRHPCQFDKFQQAVRICQGLLAHVVSSGLLHGHGPLAHDRH